MTGTPSGAGAVEVFTAYRALLFTIAYEMLGSAADADDVVQESWLRWAGVDHSQVDDPRGYLARVVTRMSLNRLRSLRRQREVYVGPWLPEPLVTGADIADDVELAESVSFAMLVVLETLSPVERAVFVLREVFGFSYAEIAETVDKSVVAVRQIGHRARAHVRARRPAQVFDRHDHETVVRAFVAAVDGGDLQALLEVLSPEAVLTSDAGGKAKAALRPIIGAEKIARLLVGLRAQAETVEVELVTVNGAPALTVGWNGQPVDSLVGLDVRGDRVRHVYLIRNPDKLTDLLPRRVTR